MASDQPGAADSQLEVGERVLVLSRHAGTVAFYGHTPFFGDCYGVALETPLAATTNGVVDGITYFLLNDESGIFVRAEHICRWSREIVAVMRIQAQGRRYVASKRVSKERLWRTWNALDNNEEQLNLRRGKKVQEASKAISSSMEVASRLVVKTTQPTKISVDKIVVEDSYTGPHLPWPLTLEAVLAMLEYFKQGGVLHYKYTALLLQQGRKLLSPLRTLEELQVRVRLACSCACRLLCYSRLCVPAPVGSPAEAQVHEGTRLTIVGDTHGQLQVRAGEPASQRQGQR